MLGIMWGRRWVQNQVTGRDCWQKERERGQRRNGLKRAESRGEGEVAWGEEKRKSRETEKQTWRRWGIDEAESWVIPAVNLCVFAVIVCANVHMPQGV